VILSPFKPPANASPAGSPRIRQNGKRGKRGKAVQNKDHKLCCGSHRPAGERNAFDVAAFYTFIIGTWRKRLIFTHRRS
jgi:hypothetical protein